MAVDVTRPPLAPLDYASPTSPRVPPQAGNRLKVVLYWVTGNFWLLVALVLFVGRKYERSGPLMYSTFGVGRWFTETEYLLVVLAPVVLGVSLVSLGIWHLRRLGRGE